MFVDLPGSVSHSVVTGHSLRPDLLLEVHNKCLYILELSIGYETNRTSNIARKDRKYQDLTRTLQRHCNNFKLINLSISTLGVLSSHSADFLTMLKESSIEYRHLTYIQRKISTIITRSTYYNFCQPGHDWKNPELLALVIISIACFYFVSRKKSFVNYLNIVKLTIAFRNENITRCFKKYYHYHQHKWHYRGTQSPYELSKSMVASLFSFQIIQNRASLHL